MAIQQANANAEPVEGGLYQLGPDVLPAWLAGRRAFFVIDRVRTSSGNVIESRAVRVRCGRNIVTELIERFDGVRLQPASAR